MHDTLGDGNTRRNSSSALDVFDRYLSSHKLQAQLGVIQQIGPGEIFLAQIGALGRFWGKDKSQSYREHRVGQGFLVQYENARPILVNW